jgi:hypothetical protein
MIPFPAHSSGSAAEVILCDSSRLAQVLKRKLVENELPACCQVSTRAHDTSDPFPIHGFFFLSMQFHQYLRPSLAKLWIYREVPL